MALLAAFFLLALYPSKSYEESVEMAEKQTRCAAHCYEFNEKAPPTAPYECDFSKDECRICFQPCHDEGSLENEDTCKKFCKTDFKNNQFCLESCDFIARMDNLTFEKSDLPQRIVSVDFNASGESSRLTWSQKNDLFYTKSSKSKEKAVLFLVLKAEVSPSSYKPDEADDLLWEFTRTLAGKEITTSDLRSGTTIKCNTYYVFKVAGVNEYGIRSYSNPSQVISSEELGVPKDSCVSWCHPNSCPKPQYCGNQPSFVPIDIGNSVNLDKDSLLQWNENCFNPLASRSITWNATAELAGDFCYVARVIPSACEDASERLYYIRKNVTTLLMEQLSPGCTFFAIMAAGSVKPRLSDVKASSQLTLKIPIFHPECGLAYQRINIAFTTVALNFSSNKYWSNVTWMNPPDVQVDAYDIIVAVSGKNRPIGSRTVPYKGGINYKYSYYLVMEPNKEYFISIQPTFDNYGYTSTELRFSTSPLKPPIPFNFTVSTVPETVDLLLEWEINDDEVHQAFPLLGFNIVYYTEDESSTEFKIQLNDSNARTYQLMDLEPATLYYVKIQALNSAGASESVTEQHVTLASLKSKVSIVPIVVPVVCILVVIVITIVIVSVLCVGREKKQYQERIHMLELATYHPPRLAPCFDPAEPADEWEIDPDNLNLLEVLGEGFFGIVLKGEVMHNASANASPSTPRRLGSRRGMHQASIRSRGSVSTVKTVVACKMLKEDGTNEDQMDLMKEVKLMKKIGQHKHIVSMLGAITRSHPICLIVEYCPHGDVQQYLRAARPAWLIANRRKSGIHLGNRYSSLPGTLKETEGYMEMNASPAVPPAPPMPSTPAKVRPPSVVDLEAGAAASAIPNEEPKISAFDLLSFCRQIAAGMEFLSGKGLVHRDLACRNVLVGEGKLLKISDFGLTRAVYQDATYTQKSRSRLPLKWMSIEAVMDRVFTVASDVWSFGIAMWEICTLGGFPYPTISNEELLSRLRKGYRMERPENCSEELYGIMIQCWHPDPERRPIFSLLNTALAKMLEAEKPDLYVDLNFSQVNPFWMSIDELSENDSDAEPDVPFDETHLRQISFEEGYSSSALNVAMREVRGESFRALSTHVDEDVFPPLENDNGYLEPTEMIAAMYQNGNGATLQNGQALAATSAV